MALRTIVSRSRGMRRVELARPRRLLVHDLLDQPSAVACLERRPQRQQFVERQAQAVDVAAASHLAARSAPGPCSAGCRRCRRCASGRRCPRALARPKSVTQTVPVASSSRFDGLMSRCRMPWRGRRPGVGHLHADRGPRSGSTGAFAPSTVVSSVSDRRSGPAAGSRGRVGNVRSRDAELPRSGRSLAGLGRTRPTPGERRRSRSNRRRVARRRVRPAAVAPGSRADASRSATAAPRSRCSSSRT